MPKISLGQKPDFFGVPQNAQNAPKTLLCFFSLCFFKGVVKTDVSCALRKRGKN